MRGRSLSDRLDKLQAYSLLGQYDDLENWYMQQFARIAKPTNKCAYRENVIRIAINASQVEIKTLYAN